MNEVYPSVVGDGLVTCKSAEAVHAYFIISLWVGLKCLAHLTARYFSSRCQLRMSRLLWKTTPIDII